MSVITNYRQSVQRAKTPAAKQMVMSNLYARIKSIRLVNWPALEHSFMEELIDCEQLARQAKEKQ